MTVIQALVLRIGEEKMTTEKFPLSAEKKQKCCSWKEGH
jgi:hypothetical protein